MFVKADEVVGAAVVAAGADYTFQFVGEPTSSVDELLLTRQNGAVFSGTLEVSLDGTTYITVGSFTNVLAISVFGGARYDYARVKVTGQPALSVTHFSKRSVTNSSIRSFNI